MPELPEAEVARRGLSSCVVDRRIEWVLVARKQSIRTPLEDEESFSRMLRGRVIRTLSRQGKALIFGLDEALDMVFHFKLGAFVHCNDRLVRETGGVALNFAGNGSLEFTDMGLSEFHLVEARDLQTVPVLKQGIDPLSRAFTAKKLSAILPAHKQLKAALIDQDVIAGIGNTYSDEILWSARIRPFRKVTSLSSEEIADLARETRATLRKAIAKGGERGFRGPDGREGRFETIVHRKAGHKCPRDGHEIEMVRKGRKTFYCPYCQK